jgi:hypothetical protein
MWFALSIAHPTPHSLIATPQLMWYLDASLVYLLFYLQRTHQLLPPRLYPSQASRKAQSRSSKVGGNVFLEIELIQTETEPDHDNPMEDDEDNQSEDIFQTPENSPSPSHSNASTPLPSTMHTHTHTPRPHRLSLKHLPTFQQQPRLRDNQVQYLFMESSLLLRERASLQQWSQGKLKRLWICQDDGAIVERQ